MAKGNAKLLGPLYTDETAKSLGGHKVEGPKSGKSPADPLGFMHKGGGGKGTTAKKPHRSKD